MRHYFKGRYFDLHKDDVILNTIQVYEIRNGELVDISETEIYLKIVAEKDKAKRISEIKEELEKLDLKCIRALREGGNALDGTPYLEKYQAEINILRDELNSLG